ncbi:velvet factor-domain-containing protein [Radiomyces spectabilis]|uniref:velvet factor-domain-containing protein n=1 Tax=Radiomyces spectabilis TaxID=64574 RepID=UPI00221EEB5B|nr:velvet factor-domain-containing protein [Radiomyces spectabilis]KAI8394184.1 velvet factor-domain-containing protein [Radiomyces spectabilis]
MDDSVSYHFATVKQRRENRHEIEYHLALRQQPKQSRMCGVGEKADRRPIDPPPIVQLKVYDPSTSYTDRNAYLQNPYYFMYASLMAADLDEELHLLGDGKTRSTTGSVVSSLYHLKDIDNTDAGFFVFPDLSVRMEGTYRLKLSLFEIIGKEVFHCKSIISDVFVVYSAKKFPGMEESTFLSRSFADQGLKIRIRKELRQRRKISRRKGSEESSPNPIDLDSKAVGKRIKKTGSTSADMLVQATTLSDTSTPVISSDAESAHSTPSALSLASSSTPTATTHTASNLSHSSSSFYPGSEVSHRHLVGDTSSSSVPASDIRISTYSPDVHAYYPCYPLKADRPSINPVHNNPIHSTSRGVVAAKTPDTVSWTPLTGRSSDDGTRRQDNNENTQHPPSTHSIQHHPSPQQQQQQQQPSHSTYYLSPPQSMGLHRSTPSNSIEQVVSCAYPPPPPSYRPPSDTYYHASLYPLTTSNAIHPALAAHSLNCPDLLASKSADSMPSADSLHRSSSRPQGYPSPSTSNLSTTSKRG